MNKETVMLTTKEVAKRLGRTPQRVLQLIGEGRLKAERFGWAFMIDERQLKAFRLTRPTGRPKKQK